MRASIERSLYIGICKTRFDIFDNVKLKLNNGTGIEGIIEDLTSNTVTLSHDDVVDIIYVNQIEDYIS